MIFRKACNVFVQKNPLKQSFMNYSQFACLKILIYEALLPSAEHLFVLTFLSCFLSKAD